MSRLVFVVPLKEGTFEQAKSLLAQGPPFDLVATEFDRHEVYLTDREVVFVFESPGPSGTLRLAGEDSSLWQVAAAWTEIMAAKPRKAGVAYVWARPDNGEAVFFEATPGPGDSEGGELFPPES